MSTDRRRCLKWVGVAGLGSAMGLSVVRLASGAEKEKKDEDEEVEAAEDLMREHGVLRRALLVYSEAASRLLSRQGEVPADALGKTAALFRSFGEEYHERSLEERHVFPVLVQKGGRNATLANTLKQQHDRGREITDRGGCGSQDRFLDELSGSASLVDYLSFCLFVNSFPHTAQSDAKRQKLR